MERIKNWFKEFSKDLAQGWRDDPLEFMGGMILVLVAIAVLLGFVAVLIFAFVTLFIQNPILFFMICVIVSLLILWVRYGMKLIDREKDSSNV